MISAVSNDPDSTAEKLSGACVPGMPNLHSHAFQRAMAGLTEIGGGTENNFWSWQKVMYDFLAALRPEDVEAIAAQLYVEMLKGGYTSVGEFHYLHHGPGGKTYSDPNEMSNRIFSAAPNDRPNPFTRTIRSRAASGPTTLGWTETISPRH